MCEDESESSGVIEEAVGREAKTLPEGNHPLSDEGPQPSSAPPPPTADVALTPEQISKRTVSSSVLLLKRKASES